MIITSSTRTRRGGSCLKDIYIYIRPFSSIELACAVRQRSSCVRALCQTGVLFHMSHLKLHVTLHTWQSSHFTLHSSHCTLRSQHFTSHCTLKTPHFTLHTALFALGTSHFTVHTSRFTLHTSHCTLHALSHCTLHTSHFTLHAPHFTLHSSHPTLHLIWPLLTLSQLSSSHLISSHMSSKLSWITSQYYYKENLHAQCASQAVRACFVRSCCNVVVQGCRAKQKKDDFDALFKRIFKRKISTVKIAKIYSKITIAAWMQPLQYDLRCSAAKDNSITHAAAAPTNVEHTRCRAPASSPKHSPCNIHAAITMRSATTASGNA